jgi:hypothetical protein
MRRRRQQREHRRMTRAPLYRSVVTVAVVFLAAVAAPAGASARALSDDAVNHIMFNTLADDWSCRPIATNRVDCERDRTDPENDDDGPICHDLIAFILVGDTVDWRFYRDGCSTGIEPHPRWATPLRPVPWTLLYSYWATGTTSQASPITVGLFRQFRDSGRFAFGSIEEMFVTVRLSCSNGVRRRAGIDVRWNVPLAGRRSFHAIGQDYNTDTHVVMRGRLIGRARTGLSATLRATQDAGGVVCRSGPVRFTASASRLALF